ncbi:alpha/beta fold hydrolase [Nocardia transvalensis]|nr:alpha/beta fold hydrolase [Nocardia transvalensis]
MVLPGPEGSRAPTIVFEAGAAASRSTWALVQPLVGQWARAIVYDRSGFGRSAPDPRSRTLDRMSGDLGEVLDHFGAGPYVLVAHSAGAPITRTAAAANPDRIAGLVLVDPTDEGLDLLFGPAFRRSERRTIALGLVAARMKLLRPFFRSLTAPLPPDARRDMRREGFTVQAMKTFAAQERTFLDELAAYRENPPNLRDLPVTVISGGRAGNGMNDELRAILNNVHALRAAQSPKGRHVVAEHSGHYPLLSEPHLVADEIRRLVDTTIHTTD